MGTCDKFLCLRLFIVALVFVADTYPNDGKVSSEKEHLELERQLKAINKPAIKSFQTEDGDIFDCVDIHKQLAFDHPVLKNHTLRMRPRTIPRWISDSKTSHEGDSLQFLPDNVKCPDGTVIIKRATKQDLLTAQLLKSMGFSYLRNPDSKFNGTNSARYHYAVAAYKYLNYGAKGNINVWDLVVSPHQLSAASMRVAGGSKARLAGIQAGGIVNRDLYPDHNRLYTYWTADGYNKTGCFNTLCPGFVQISKRIPLGVILRPVSTYNGRQFQIAASIYEDHRTGHWWFLLRDEYIGYWPKSLFKGTGLDGYATFASWGGEVYSPVKEKSPPMGSGHFAEEWFGKSAFVSGLKVISEFGEIYDPTDTKILADHPECYDARYVKDGHEPWVRGVFFGGPGGCTF